MKIHLFFTVLFIGYCCQIPAQRNATFPDSWDTNRDLRGAQGQVLAWTHKIDTARPYEYKHCLILFVAKDSSGKDEYFVAEMYTNEKPFNKWHYSAIHFGPDPPRMFGFHDLHLEQFDHRPSRQEMYKLLDRWMFKLTEEGWIIQEWGIDEKLWMQYFGFIPERI